MTARHLLLLSLALGCTSSEAKPAPAPQIRQVAASVQGISVNCYLVEGEHGVVAIDSALTVSDGKALRKRVDALGKPLLAILLTHGHPDHYNGVSFLVEGRQVPIYATAAVAKVIRESDAAKTAQWKPVFKDEWPATRTFPDHEVKDNERLTFDQMVFVAHDLGPGESHADSYWELLGADRAAFIGDEVLNGEHAYTNDGHTGAWLENLERLERELAGVKHIYPGHGAPGDASIFAWQRGYLTTYRKHVDALRAGGDKLGERQKAELVEKMKAAYPKAGLEFMIALGADTVATELARAKSGKH